MIQVIFDKGYGVSHHMGGDYESVDKAVEFAEKMVEVSPSYKSAVVTENGEIKAEVK